MAEREPPPGRPFRKGESGNPGGRPKADPVLREQIAKAAPAVIRKLIALAKAGNVRAATVLLDRVLPALKPTAAPVELPLDAAASLTDQGRAVLAAVTSGDCAPDVGSELLSDLMRLAALKQFEELEAKLAMFEHGSGHDLV